ncbi:T9SS type A sorting domain-containing protein [Flammeovirga yaeyamensis]|uniref:T9SS type A sorting domain-containing protein n=1 Tax=Flammeovirga yaeyamensis TaxID=367791 RepID=A0AAX1NBB6_9BACT|nr:T9SS type A sorting domain-containing protein [Flammeovirga yaeyamensis]MBB3697227.1 hypothetical protein [Flammeovirga yaeyamensis]NMF33886.1 T9SS type A sorting domain-containing protein [Flammeovirga yaeyamensis]QWG04854.1 T9SS type A sorting domain-containing protein [Flammeovirga yaeyamensis]
MNRVLLKTSFRMLFILAMIPFIGNAQDPNWGKENRWESLNPGGGGQIQDVYFDRNVEGRIWFSSDMEGVYRSDDFGQSWQYVSKDLSHGMAFCIAQEEGGSKLYQGGLYGAHVAVNPGASNHHNVSWDMIEETRGDAIASIAISSDHQTVVLAPGWQNKDPQKGQGSLIDPNQNLQSDKFNGERNIYLSKDRGATWTKVKYDNTNGYRNVFGVAIHPTNDNIYLGAASGVFVSSNGGNSFNLIAKPSEAIGPAGNATSITKRPDGGSRGVGLSPDGKYIYATYQTQGGSTYADRRWAVFVAKTSSTGITGGWTKIMDGLTDTAEWYDPKVDPRSTATEHRLLVGTVWNDNKNRIGLWEATVNYNGSGNVTSYNWEQILNLPKNNRCFDFEPSWERRDFIVRTCDYTPKSWNQHQIISMGGMNVFLTDADAVDFPCSSWKEVYGEVIYYQEGLAMSHERGFSSPYCYDVDSYKSYMIQGCADHGILQSLDNGYSWTSEHGPQGITNAMSVLTVPTNPALVLMDARKGYGAPSQSVGGLYAKPIELDRIGNAEDWKLIGGFTPNNSGTTNDLPSRNYRAMQYDPSNPKRVYVTMRGKNWGGANIEGGVYMTDDILAVYNGNGSWRKISESSMGYRDFRDVWVDPNNGNYIYVRSAGSGSAGSIYRGVRQSNGSYTWTNMETASKNTSDIYAWEKDGQTWLVAAAQINNVYGVHILKTPRNADWNDPSNWTFTGLDVAKTLEIRPEKWVEPNEPISIGGLAAFDDRIVANSEVSNHKKGNGSFIGVIQNNGTVQWSDWTRASANDRDIENPTSLQAKVRVEDGVPYYYVALAGTGPWRRQISSAVTPPTCSLSVNPNSVAFASNGGTKNISVTSTDAFSASSNQGWLSVSTSNNQISVVASANTSEQSRNATVTVSGCKNVSISITQEGASVTPPPTGDLFTETLDNMPTENQWANGSFVGNYGLTWDYVQVKRTSTINGNTIKLDNSANGSLSTSLSNGLTYLSFWAAPTGTGSPSGVEVYVNGQLIQSFEIAKGAAPQEFVIPILDESGTTALEFRGMNASDVQLDDISWKDNSAVTLYQLTVNNGSGSGSYAAGEIVTVTANAPAAGKQFNEWTGAEHHLANRNNASTQFTMPSNGATITATYVDLPSGDSGFENFDLLGTLNDWSTGSFVGNDGQVWNYSVIKRTQTINGNTVKLDNNAGGSLSTTLNGLSTLTFKAAPTGSANSSGVIVKANGNTIGQFDIAANSGSNTFTINNIDLTGSVALEFTGYNNADVQLDDIEWNAPSGARRVVSNQLLDEEVKVYPNPFNDQIKLQGVDQGTVTIFSITGNIVYQNDYQKGDTIVLNYLTKGMYILRVNDKTFKIKK